MIIDKSNVRMWTQNVTHVKREHTIYGGVNGVPEKRFDESVSASPVTANFDVEKAPPETFSSVKKLIAMLEKSAENKNTEGDGWLLLRLKLLLAWMLLLRLFGDEEEEKKHGKKSVPDSVFPTGDRARPAAAIRVPPPSANGGSGSRGISGETLEETRETLFFEAHGSVVTKDGEEIPVDIRLRLNDDRREIFGLDEEIARSLIDPLVVNFENESVQLTDQKFSFDLDIDGAPDNIVMPASGSAFLALDRNGDGVIGDGSELFGVTSGDGFKDLAVFDDDKNGFIDEGDKIYDQLRLFTRNSEGKDVVFTLREKGVKAISLENLATSLRLKDGSAQLRKTGFIIRENKTASTIQHVDLRPEPLVPAQNLVKPNQADYEV